MQLDPLNVTARSQDIVLHSRVMDYKPGYLYQVAYKHREFFDYGGWPAIYPMSELPFFSVHMEKRSHDKRVGDFKLSSPDHLVARLDPKLDRTTMTLEIKGFWHEDDAPVKNVDFANALAKGLIRFLNFVGAKKITTNAIRPAALRKQVDAILKAGV